MSDMEKQSFRAETLDVEVGHFSLVYGKCEAPHIWVSKIDGKKLPPHRKVTIVIEAGKQPVVAVEFVTELAGRRDSCDSAL